MRNFLKWLPLAAIPLALLLVSNVSWVDAQTFIRLHGVTYPLTNGKIPVLATISGGSSVTARNNAQVEGCIAHSSDGTPCYPVIVGGVAGNAPPTAVADNEAVQSRYTQKGALHVVSRAGTATLSNTNDAAISTTLLAANSGRIFAQCYNDSTSILYLSYGGTATSTDFSEYVPPGATWRTDEVVTTVAINGIWSADASGAARCTELTE